MSSLSSKFLFRSIRKSFFSTTTTTSTINASTSSSTSSKQLNFQFQSMAPSEPSIIHPTEYSTNAEKFAKFIHSNKGKTKKKKK